MSLNLLLKIFYNLFKIFETNIFFIHIRIEFQILAPVYLIDLWFFVV